MGSTSENSFNVAMNDIMAALNALREENQELRGTISGLQESQARSASIMVQNQVKEPRISLPEKFDGNRSKLRGFINQVRLIIQLQPYRYPTSYSQVGLVGTLLSGTALGWFGPLLEKQSPLLSDFEAFIAEFSATFGEHDKVRAATTKIRVLRQGNRPAATYVSEFQQLACDTNWDDAALMSQLYWGLRDDVKDLLLTMPDANTLMEAYLMTIRCDNRLYERRMEERRTQPFRRNIAMGGNNFRLGSPESKPEDMQIDATRYKPLTQKEKNRRREEGWCLYCGESTKHNAANCPKKRRKSYYAKSAVPEDVSENETTQSQ